MAIQAAQAALHVIAKPGFWSTLSSMWGLLTITINRSERIVDNSLGSLEELSEMALTATKNMHEEQRITARQSIAELEAMSAPPKAPRKPRATKAKA
jgi:hypothetical protein